MTRIAALALAATLTTGGTADAVELLFNGSLDVPGIHEGELATGWTLAEGPGAVNAASFASFADHTTDGVPGGVGLWLRAFAGGTETQPEPVFADLTQTVPGTPGLGYTLSAWSRFETNYPGGVANLNQEGTDGSDPFDGPASPTDTFLALEFLDAGDAVLPGSLEVELLADGQVNGGGWLQHVLNAVAPAGTASIRVRGSMIGGVLNPGINPQSAFLDDFSLLAGVLQVPEPGSLAVLAAGGLLLAARRRRYL